MIVAISLKIALTNEKTKKLRNPKLICIKLTITLIIFLEKCEMMVKKD